MPRRTFLRFTRAKVLGEETLKQYLHHFSPAALYSNWQQLPGLTSQDLFANDRPLEIEIGCGSAEYLCFLAAQASEINFVGIDLSGPSLHKAVELASYQQLENIRFLHANFQLMYPLLHPRALHAVYLHFPDPHCKSDHHKRRLFNQQFLDAIASSLVDKGRLSVMTDLRDFFMEMLVLVEQDTRFVKEHPQRYLLGFEPAITSHFQRIWQEHGEAVYRFEVSLANRAFQKTVEHVSSRYESH